MAGDWIPMRLDLAEDPAVIYMAEQLGVSEFEIVGRCHAIWAWVSRNCRASVAPSVALLSLGRVTRTGELPLLMRDVGWLDEELIDGKPSVKIVKFDRWNSRTAKKRLENSERQRRRRADVT